MKNSTLRARVLSGSPVPVWLAHNGLIGMGQAGYAGQ